jgi:hypothetical protein
MGSVIGPHANPMAAAVSAAIKTRIAYFSTTVRKFFQRGAPVILRAGPEAAAFHRRAACRNIQIDNIIIAM